MNFDVIIVGGGLIGQTIAYRLSQQKIRVAIVFKGNELQDNASSAAGGMFGVFSEISSNENIDRCIIDVGYRLESRKMYENLLTSLQDETGMEIQNREGLLVIANSNGENDRKELEQMSIIAKKFDANVEWLNTSDLPILSPQSDYPVLDAIFLEDEGCVDTNQLLKVLECALSESQYVQIIDDWAESIDNSSSAQISIKLLKRDEPLYCENVVLACGAMQNLLVTKSNLQNLGIPRIYAGRGVSLIFKSEEQVLPYPIRTPNRGFACGLHIVPRANNKIYLGATNRFSTSPDISVKPTLSEVNNLLTGAIQEINVNFKYGQMLSSSVGYRPVTIDKRPILGRTKDNRILVASGTYRNGVLLAPLIAELIVEEIQNNTQLAAHPYSVQREMASLDQTDLEALLRIASRSLVSTLCEPVGQLPDTREKELADYFYVTLNMILNPEMNSQLVKLSANRLFTAAPMEECVPLLFDMVSRMAN